MFYNNLFIRNRVSGVRCQKNRTPDTRHLNPTLAGIWLRLKVCIRAYSELFLCKKSQDNINQ